MEQTVFHNLYIEGQSVWLNAIRGAMITNHTLKDLIARGLRGINVNLTLLNTELITGTDYIVDLVEFCQSYKTPFEIYDAITIKNIQSAADMFFPVYEITKGLDGYVSLDINPKLAYIPQALVQEGIRLFEKIRRPNVMFKIMATDEGLEAMEELLAYGINVHVTFIFSPTQYHKTAQRYMRGITRFLEKGALGRTVSSVASTFPQRIDAAIDALLDNALRQEHDKEKQIGIADLKGKAGISTCAVLYRSFLDFFSSEEFNDLYTKGAHMQRVSWDLTSRDNAAYTDMRYVTDLIANNTINTMPEETFKTFLDKGEAKVTLTADISEAQHVLESLKTYGIPLDEIYAQLLTEGIQTTNLSFEAILQTLEVKKKAM